jgi:DNA-binding GntR family transcriptional regulator
VDANIMKQLSFNIEASNNENLDFFIRMAQLKKSSFVCEVLSEYRDHQGARESSNLLGMIAGLEFIVSQHLDFIKNQKYWLSEKYLSLAIMIKKTNGDINKRNHYFLKSVIHRPFYLRNWAHWLFSFFR